MQRLQQYTLEYMGIPSPRCFFFFFGSVPHLRVSSPVNRRPALAPRKQKQKTWPDKCSAEMPHRWAPANFLLGRGDLDLCSETQDRGAEARPTKRRQSSMTERPASHSSQTTGGLEANWLCSRRCAGELKTHRAGFESVYSRRLSAHRRSGHHFSNADESCTRHGTCLRSPPMASVPFLQC